jgi:hypothetical protein
MGSLGKSMRRDKERKREREAVVDYRASERWSEILEFCRHHAGHGDMEYQSTGDEQYMACLLCSKSFNCGELPQVLFKELLRRFPLSVG